MLFQLDDSGIYFAASLHLLRPEHSTLSNAVLMAHKSADLVVFEADLDLKGEPRNARLKPPAQLQHLISPELYDATAALWRELNLSGLENCTPWWAAIVLSFLLPTRAGYTETGVDKQLWNITPPEKRLFLESINALKIFDDVSPEVLEGYLAYGVADTDRVIRQMDSLASAWHRQDLAGIESFFTMSMSLFPTIMRPMIDDRNWAWMSEILRVVGLSRPTVFVLGAMHFAGDASIQKLMKEHGHILAQV